MGRPCGPPPPLPSPYLCAGPENRIQFSRVLNKQQAPKKKNSIGVSQSNILIDATISSSFQIKPWWYEEMKNSDEKVNIRAFSDVRNWRKNWRKRKRYLGGEELLTYTRWLWWYDLHTAPNQCKHVHRPRLLLPLSGPLHMSPVDRAGPGSEISPYL